VKVNGVPIAGDRNPVVDSLTIATTYTPLEGGSQIRSSDGHTIDFVASTEDSARYLDFHDDIVFRNALTLSSQPIREWSDLSTYIPGASLPYISCTAGDPEEGVPNFTTIESDLILTGALKGPSWEMLTGVLDNKLILSILFNEGHAMRFTYDIEEYHPISTQIWGDLTLEGGYLHSENIAYDPDTSMTTIMTDVSVYKGKTLTLEGDTRFRVPSPPELAESFLYDILMGWTAGELNGTSNFELRAPIGVGIYRSALAIGTDLDHETGSMSLGFDTEVDGDLVLHKSLTLNDEPIHSWTDIARYSQTVPKVGDDI
jgi:hypothetical protein